jgi:hypothetical protein
MQEPFLKNVDLSALERFGRFLKVSGEGLADD